jgi:Flp pilus assembly protein TadD
VPASAPGKTDRLSKDSRSRLNSHTRVRIDPAGAFAPRSEALHEISGLGTGRTNEALQELRAAVQAAPANLSCRSGLGVACGALGRRSEALEQLQALETLPSQQRGVALSRAVIHVGLGQTNEALTFMEQALAEKDPSVLWLKVEPAYDRLRGDPRFKEMLKKLGLDQ